MHLYVALQANRKRLQRSLLVHLLLRAPRDQRSATRVHCALSRDGSESAAAANALQLRQLTVES